MDDFVESREKMEQFLGEKSVGYLGVVYGGLPYVVPLDYSYAGGRILFHCAVEGHKLDAIRANPAVCFTVARQRGQVVRHSETVCHPDSQSVVCLGRARVVDDLAERAELLDAFNCSFRPDAEPISADSVAGCGAVEIVVEEMTGRREEARRLSCWHYRFD